LSDLFSSLALAETQQPVQMPVSSKRALQMDVGSTPKKIPKRLPVAIIVVRKSFECNIVGVSSRGEGELLDTLKSIIDSSSGGLHAQNKWREMSERFYQSQRLSLKQGLQTGRCVCLSLLHKQTTKELIFGQNFDKEKKIMICTELRYSMYFFKYI
jgi:hypothetical protein